MNRFPIDLPDEIELRAEHPERVIVWIAAVLVAAVAIGAMILFGAFAP